MNKSGIGKDHQVFQIGGRSSLMVMHGQRIRSVMFTTSAKKIISSLESIGN